MLAVLGFLGGGKMAEALIGGALSSGVATAGEIVVCDKEAARREHLARVYGVRVTDRAKDLIGCPIILLAVKPQDIQSAAAAIQGDVSEKHLLVSIMAGVSIASLQRLFAGPIPTIRVMPNTPALLRQGMSAFACSENVPGEQKAVVTELLRSIGDVVEVAEANINQVTAVSGSGPAYFFLFTEYLASAGERLGLDRDLAYRLAIQTAVGAAEMLRNSGRSPEELVGMVASPGGTTEAALNEFDQLRLGDIITGAVTAAWKRAAELDKMG